jgi:hypothetical protein
MGGTLIVSPGDQVLDVESGVEWRLAKTPRNAMMIHHQDGHDDQSSTSIIIYGP